VRVQPAKILFLGVLEHDDLVLSLRNVLKADSSFKFELRHEILENPLTSLSRIPPGSLSNARPDLIVLHVLEVERKEAEGLFTLVQRHFENVPILIVPEIGEPTVLFRLFELGAADFITQPFRPIEVLPRLRRLLYQTCPDDPVVVQVKERIGLKQFIGESKIFLAEIEKIPVIARCDATALIAGETGTGKEMVARAIHHLSQRSANPFVPVNCGAIPLELVENELFGHEAGAFTGAQSSSAGLLSKAADGSLFLDEVDCLPLLAQVKLLRFLQEKEFRPLGANKPSHADVRVIAASNTNLEEAVRNGRFRQDLYFRLNVVGLTLPPLRDRKEDIPFLARHFIAKHASVSGTCGRDLSPAAVQKLMLYDWPGNIRELENVIARSTILSSKAVLAADDIQLRNGIPVMEGESLQRVKARMIAQFERGFILDRLHDSQGNIAKAAAAAGKNRRAFWELMRKYRIHVQPKAVG
jgi:two-component system, NtrC family, response regulator GlrR